MPRSQAKPRQPIYEGHTDLLVFLLLSAGVFFVNWGLRLFWSSPSPQALGRRSTKSKVQKFAQSSMEMVFYGAFTVFGALVVPGQEWFWPSKLWWMDFPRARRSSSRTPSRPITFYAARYAQGIVSCLIEHKRKDFWEMQIHHVVTVSLIGVSYAFGWNRVGAVVHGPPRSSDVPSTSPSSSSTSATLAGRHPEDHADGRGRLLRHLHAPLRGDAPRALPVRRVVGASRREDTSRTAGRVDLRGLLYILLVLQVYWFALIVKVAIKVVTSGAAEDVRSDDEEEDEEPEDKKKK